MSDESRQPSIYTARIANSLRHLHGDVPDALMNAAKDDATRYLLSQASTSEQAKVIIAETLDQILFQTTTTNGTVHAHGKQIARHEKQLRAYRIIGGIALLILPSLGIKILEFIMSKVHF